MLIDTRATYTVLPKDVLEEVGASMIPGDVEVELGDGKKARGNVCGVRV